VIAVLKLRGVTSVGGMSNVLRGLFSYSFAFTTVPLYHHENAHEFHLLRGVPVLEPYAPLPFLFFDVRLEGAHLTHSIALQSPGPPTPPSSLRHYIHFRL
jgi:hypothetical protein